MGHLFELFAAPVVAPGLRGDALLPVARLKAAGAPAAFAFDPDKHHRDERGRWAGAAGGGERVDRDDPAAPGRATAVGARPESPPFPAVASYARGRAMAAAVAALPHAVGDAQAALATATAAFKRWPQENPDKEPYGREHNVAYRAVEAAETAMAQAKLNDRFAFLEAHGPVQPLAWEPVSRHPKFSRADSAFHGGVKFVAQLVSAATGASPKLVCVKGKGPCYRPTTGVIEAPESTKNAAVFAHEIGHHVEWTAPGVQKLCQEFHVHRTDGEEPADLYEMGLTDVPDAVGYKDHFDRVFPEKRAYYAGRVYPSGGTEILSMAMEALYDDPVGFAKKDPEYFAFAVGVLSGDLTGKGASHAG